MNRNALSEELFPRSYISKMSVHLATNPVHIYTRNRHISIFSGNLAGQLEKNGLVVRNGCKTVEQLATEISKVIISNAYLAPGTSKTFDSPLALWESPDLIVFADKTMPALAVKPNARTQFVNLPSFSEDSFKFKVFYCDNLVVEDSAIC